MALFEGYERRIDQINAVLNSYGISSIEEAEKITKDAGLDVYEQVKKIQPICFENACWAYTVGAAIAIKKGCKKATGNENEFCTLLSDKAKSIALPMLLCSEEVVEGNHSSAAGKVEEKELFYIMSRGFNLKEAMKLIVKAKFNKIIENIINERLKEEILEEIDKRLD
mgnify:CR=1 FL=1